jgi:hypothetical protein
MTENIIISTAMNKKLTKTTQSAFQMENASTTIPFLSGGCAPPELPAIPAGHVFERSAHYPTAQPS